MSNIIQFHTPQEERLKYRFINHAVSIRLWDKLLMFPCIALVDQSTGLIAGLPGYERWLFDLTHVAQLSSATLKHKASTLCVFLNFILWNTSLNYIHEVDLNTLQEFVASFRKTGDSQTRTSSGWSRGIGYIYEFLINYYEKNRETYDFHYSPEELVSVQCIVNSETKRKAIIREYNKLAVPPPGKKSKKNRLLLHGYGDLLLYECRKYDPMIALAVALSLYAGIREGEVANLTVGSLSPIYAGFGQIGKIKIDLMHDAPFAEKWSGKAPFGTIKIHRMQEVFPDFISDVMDLLDEHLRLLESAGASLEKDAPLFVNHWGGPMSASTYSHRLRAVFEDHFVPDLKSTTLKEGSWAENAPYIEAYEAEYPGAHMLRHWFTMYLVQKTQLSADEISRWRGDSSPESMYTYVHQNADMLKAYQDSLYIFQKTLLEELNE